MNEIETSYFLLIVVSIYIVFVLLGGKFVDQYGAKNLLLIGQLIIIGFGSLFFIVSQTVDFFLFIVSSVFSGIGFALSLTAGNSILLKTIDKTQPTLKGTGFGFNNALGFFCGAVGPMLFSILGTVTIFLPYYIIIVLTAISFAITIGFLDK